MLSSPDQLGLRERKKARTRAAIQRQALRLFRERGYEATTVTQIAEAAEVSESTFFRYFPTKEDVVLWDEFDPALVDVFRRQPPELSPIAALRAAVRQLMAGFSPEQMADQRERMDLTISAPPLRARMMDQLRDAMHLLAEVVADRSGRDPTDPAVRALAGAVLGVGIAAMFVWAEDPEANLIELWDEGLAQLEAGFPL
ncbi:MAG: TetR family transcriptional regulator [Candidatus Dormibacteraeota bacterium]|nr:TetR family transcriptional regulator [Candidatus Dormibacteraeota bacterium]